MKKGSKADRSFLLVSSDGERGVVVEMMASTICSGVIVRSEAEGFLLSANALMNCSITCDVIFSLEEIVVFVSPFNSCSSFLNVVSMAAVSAS